MLHEDDAVSFPIPDGLTLRAQSAPGVSIYRMNHAQVRMELNVLVGETLALAAMGTRTRISYFPPEGSDGPTPEDCGRIGSLFVAAVEADTRLEARAGVEVVRDAERLTEKGLVCRERTLLMDKAVLKQIALVFARDARRAALVGYMTHHSNLDRIEAWKEQVLQGIEVR